MVVGTYNSQSIIVMPSTPAPRQVMFEMNNNVAAPVNPFSGAAQQVYAWPGGDWWTAEIALPKLTPAQIPAWQGFLAECNGMFNCFMLGDASYKTSGTPKGLPLVNGAQSARATTLATKGWTPNSFRLLLPGDYLQVGVHLHRVLDVVNSDANGDATISIWPSLREATTDGETIVLNHPKGLFRLAENKQSITVDETHFGACTLKVVEVR